MSELSELEKIAIERLKAFEPADGYYLAYSGGKDSDTVKILAQLSGVKFEAVHNLTTVDAPETVRYVKSQGDVRIDYPKLNPKYRRNYVMAFERMLEARREKGKETDTWKSGEDVMKWWLGEDVNQMRLFEE